MRLVLDEMRAARPASYSRIEFAVPYPTERRQKCDLAVHAGGEHWFIEVKMWRLMEDNGKSSDNILACPVALCPASEERPDRLREAIEVRLHGAEGDSHLRV